MVSPDYSLCLLAVDAPLPLRLNPEGAEVDDGNNLTTENLKEKNKDRVVAESIGLAFSQRWLVG